MRSQRHLVANQKAQKALFTKRAWVSLYLCLAIFALIIARMIWLQVVNHEQYRGLSLKNQVQIRPLPPTRGLIYDRNGVLLAENVPSYQLVVTPEKVGRKQLPKLLLQLSYIVPISHQERDKFLNSLKRHSRGSYHRLPLKFNLSEEEVAAFVVNRHKFQGVDVVASLNRHYPKNGHTVHSVGYVGRIDEQDLTRLDKKNYYGSSHTGKTGIEYEYENLLHGVVGHEQVEVNVQGREIRVLKRTDPVAGKNLVLTIDYELQQVASAAFDNHAGALVALDPKNGDVLAMVSAPDYDPNWFVNGISNERYKSLLKSGKKPLINRAVRGQYPPGSTIKQFVALAGLESKVQSRNKQLMCRGFYQLPNDDHRYRDWKKSGHGRMSLRHAIIQSCDVYFYDLAHRLGIDRMHQYLSKFGLGKKTGIDYPGEKEGLLPSREWKRKVRNYAWYPGETLIVGIGQGYMLTTPMQLAAATAALANKGIRPVPRLLKASWQGQQTAQPQAVEYAAPVEVVDEKNWQYVLDAMHQVVANPRGTAHRLQRTAKYTIAGKTGTAQVFSIKQDEEYDDTNLSKKLRDHALFVAWAPVEDPKIAVALIVENGGHGSSVAAPIAKKVMDSYLLRASE